ncbi:hypothetical protein JCM11491_006659 [Sporobolomyces phaffii]
MSLASPVSPHPSWKVAHDPRDGRPLPARRPSAMRSSSSDHIITPAVTRFDPETADIPPSPTFAPAPDDDRQSAPSASGSTPRSAESSVPPPPSLVHRPATCPQKPSPAAAASSSPPTSLLARRRSSRSASARPELFPKLDDLKLPALPVPPLEELDDTVVGEVIGVASQATTPFAAAPPPDDADVHEAPFRPTKTYASTPFPQGRRQSFFDSEEEDDEDDTRDRESGNSDDDDDDDDDGRSTAESSILDESTDGVRRFSLTDSDDSRRSTAKVAA